MALKIQVTVEDFQSDGKHATDNPISKALRRVTGQTWVVSEGNTAYPLTAPYRAVSLPYPAYRGWREFQAFGLMEPFEFELPADAPSFKAERRGDRRAEDRRSADRRSGDRRDPSDRRTRSDRRSEARVAVAA